MSESTAFKVSDHELLHQISGGSYGEVWLARSHLGSYRAVKIVQQTRFDSERPFQREYEGIKRFEPVSRIHEGLVDILQVGRGQDGAWFYYVMELADDQATGETVDPNRYRPRTLASEIGNKGPLPTDVCIRIGLQLCSALGFLHEKGLIHRDVKPSNVIFIGNEPKLADIGLIADIHDAKTFVGTTGFIPPEGPNSPQADIYSLGKLIYEISTGKDRNDFPVLPAEGGFSDEFLELNEILLKACHTDLGQRYQSATAMAADLKLVAAGKSVRRLRDLEARLKTMRRVGMGLLVTIAVGALVYYEVNQSRQREREERERLIAHRLSDGTASLQQGDLLAALPHFVDAFHLDEINRNSLDSDRLRIGSILAACPSNLLSYALPGRPANACDFFGNWMLVTVKSNYCIVFDAVGGAAVSPQLAAGFEPQMARFAPDGQSIVTANAQLCATVFNWRTGELLRMFDHSQPVFYASFSHDGRSIVTGDRGGTACIWDVPSGSLKCLLLGHQARIASARFNKSDSLVVTTARDNTARVWHVQSGTELFKVEHKTWLTSADFSPDDCLLVTAGFDHEVMLWDLQTGRELAPPLPHKAGVSEVRFDQAGSRILTACLDGTARLWDRRTHQPVLLNNTLHQGASLMDACFGRNDQEILIASADGTLNLWALPDLNSLGARKGKRPPIVATNSLVSPDGRWRLELSDQGAELRDVSQGMLHPLPLAAAPVDFHFDDSSRRLIVLDGTTNGCLVALGSMRTVLLPHLNAVTNAVFSPDGQRVVCLSCDGTMEPRAARLWNALTGELIGSLDHQDGVLFASFSPDSQRLVTASEDFSAQVWDANTGLRIGQPLLHQEKVRYAQFAATKPWVVTCGDDRTTRVWDERTGYPLIPPLHHPQYLSRAWFVDGDRAVLTEDEDGVLWTWPLTTVTASSSALTNFVHRSAESLSSP